MLMLLSVLLDSIMVFFSSSNNSCLGEGEKNPHQTGWVKQGVEFFFHFLMVSNFLDLLLGLNCRSSSCSPRQPLPARPRS